MRHLVAVIGLVAVWASAASAEQPPSVVPPAGPSAAGVLDLPGDGFLAGSLVESPDIGTPLTTIRWRSSMFSAPVEFKIDAVKAIRFPRRPGGDRPRNTWRCQLDGGEFIEGRLAGIDDDHVTIQPLDLGMSEVRVRRAAVTRLVPADGQAIVLAPGGLDGWQTSAGHWTSPGGRPAADKAGASAVRMFEPPVRARYDLTLTWQSTPTLEVELSAPARLAEQKARAAAGKSKAAAESNRLELMSGSLQAIRESANQATFEPIADLPGDARRLRVIALVDRQQGRLAVMLPAAEGAEARTVFDATVPPKAAMPGGFAVRLRGGDVTIADVQVSEWREEGPTASSSEVQRVEAYDAEKHEFTVGRGGAARRVAADRIETALVRDEEQAAPQPGADAVRIVCVAGSRISGMLLAVTDRGLRFACPAIDGAVECPFDRLTVLEPATIGEPAAVPGRSGMLEASQGRLAGCLAGPGVGWSARGALSAVPLVVAAEGMRIDYPAPVPTKQRADFAATVYLRSGDSFPATVLAGGVEGLRLKTSAAAEVLAPAAALRAVELISAPSKSILPEKLSRLLTLPRMQQADPPTHMLRTVSGDYLRGKLLAVDGRSVRFEVLGAAKEFPRDQVSRLIWLTLPVAEEQPPAADAGPAAGHVPVQGLMADGRRMTLWAEAVNGDQLVGRHPILGVAGIDLRACQSLLVGERAIAATPVATLPYSQWVLKPADVPRVLRGAAAPAAPAPGAATPAAAPPAAAPVVIDAAEMRSLTAAEEAARAKDAGCLEPLGQLLGAKTPEVRSRAIILLRQLTGGDTRDLPFKPNDPAEKRQQDVLRWRQWIARAGGFANLNFPQPPAAAAAAAARPPRTLVLLAGQGAVIELDEEGRETFRVAVKSCHACDLLPNGHRLVADGKTLVEYDVAGRTVWTLPDLPHAPMGIYRLDNGNTLVANDGLPDAGAVREYNRDGDEVWSWNAPWREPADVERLPGGGTLVALHGANRVVEIDEAGDETWGFDVNDPLRVKRLADGNTLVVSGDDRRGWVFAPDGTVAHELGEVQDANVGKDGRILVLDHGGSLGVFDPVEGKTKNSRQLPDGATRIWRR